MSYIKVDPVSFGKEMSAKAEAYRDADFVQNPHGYTVAPYVNSDKLATAFEAGARSALDSELVLKLEAALKAEISELKRLGGKPLASSIAALIELDEARKSTTPP